MMHDSKQARRHRMSVAPRRRAHPARARLQRRYGNRALSAAVHGGLLDQHPRPLAKSNGALEVSAEDLARSDPDLASKLVVLARHYADGAQAVAGLFRDRPETVQKMVLRDHLTWVINTRSRLLTNFSDENIERWLTSIEAAVPVFLSAFDTIGNAGDSPSSELAFEALGKLEDHDLLARAREIRARMGMAEAPTAPRDERGAYPDPVDTITSFVEAYEARHGTRPEYVVYGRLMAHLLTAPRGTIVAGHLEGLGLRGDEIRNLFAELARDRPSLLQRALYGGGTIAELAHAHGVVGLNDIRSEEGEVLTRAAGEGLVAGVARGIHEYTNGKVDIEATWSLVDHAVWSAHFLKSFYGWIYVKGPVELVEGVASLVLPSTWRGIYTLIMDEASRFEVGLELGMELARNLDVVDVSPEESGRRTGTLLGKAIFELAFTILSAGVGTGAIRLGSLAARRGRMAALAKRLPRLTSIVRSVVTSDVVEGLRRRGADLRKRLDVLRHELRKITAVTSKRKVALAADTVERKLRYAEELTLAGRYDEANAINGELDDFLDALSGTVEGGDAWLDEVVESQVQVPLGATSRSDAGAATWSPELEETRHTREARGSASPVRKTPAVDAAVARRLAGPDPLGASLDAVLQRVEQRFLKELGGTSSKAATRRMELALAEIRSAPNVHVVHLAPHEEIRLLRELAVNPQLKPRMRGSFRSTVMRGGSGGSAVFLNVDAQGRLSLARAFVPGAGRYDGSIPRHIRELERRYGVGEAIRRMSVSRQRLLIVVEPARRPGTFATMRIGEELARALPGTRLEEVLAGDLAPLAFKGANTGSVSSTAEVRRRVRAMLTRLRDAQALARVPGGGGARLRRLGDAFRRYSETIEGHLQGTRTAAHVVSAERALEERMLELLRFFQGGN